MTRITLFTYNPLKTMELDRIRLIRSRTSGKQSLDYWDTKGQGYTILWHGSIYGDPPLFVRDVELFDNKFYDEQGKFKYDEQGNLKTEPHYTPRGKLIREISREDKNPPEVGVEIIYKKE